MRNISRSGGITLFMVDGYRLVRVWFARITSNRLYLLPIFSPRNYVCHRLSIFITIDQESTYQIGFSKNSPWAAGQARLRYLPSVVWFFFDFVPSSIHSSIHGTPGPVSVPIARLWLVKRSWKGVTHRVMIVLREHHGKLIKTGSTDNKRLKSITHREN